MFERKSRYSGLTLVEILVALAIVIIVGVVVATGTGTSLRRQQLFNQLKWVKASYVRARARAIEHTAPVRLTLDAVQNRIFVVWDQDRTGDFTNVGLVLGESLDPAVGTPSPYDHVVPIAFAGSGLPALPHWTGLASQGNVSEFPDDQFVVMPDGRVMAGDPSENRSGTFFFKSDNDEVYGAVHITSMGEVKMAYIYAGQEDSSDWDWTE